LSLCHFDRRAAEWPEVEKSIKQKNSRLRFVMLEIDLFLLDYGCIILIHYILAKWEIAVCDPLTLNMGDGGLKVASLSNSQVLRMIPLLVVVCLFSTPVLTQLGDDASVYQTPKENFETGDFGKFPWEQGGDTIWSITQQEKYSGIHCARAGSIDDNESTTLKLTVDCISGEISFYYKVSSEQHYDYLRFYIDGTLQDEWSGNEDWTLVSFPVRSGRRTFEWTYSKDDSSSYGFDTVWIDDIEFPVRGPCFIEAGELRMTLEDTGQGLRLASLFDLAKGTEFMEPLPGDYQLFKIRLRNTEGDGTHHLRAESGWNLTRIDSTDDLSWLITFESPIDSLFTGTTVTLSIRVEPGSNAFHLGLKVQGVPEPWAVLNVKFPHLKLANHGPKTRVLIPIGSGRVLKEAYDYFGCYPGGTASMPYFATYDNQGDAGLYIGTHDPWASYRDISIEDEGEQGSTAVSFIYRVPNPDQPGNGFEFPGEAVLQLFRGDWYDATLIYRDWVWANAKWYPKLSENGREDTPLWMKELPVWIRSQNHSTIENDVSWAKQFTNYVGVPTGLRWHMWYDAPEPHLFPAKPGFHEAIIGLKNHDIPVYVMPYTLGTSWYVLDDSFENLQLPNVLLEGAVKDMQGELLATNLRDEYTSIDMCPTSDIWKQTQKDVVLRVFNELDAKAVYMDCIGDKPAKRCFDRSHDHPTGGGSWWARSYWELVEDIRRDMPSDCILTTESSCEVYVHVFDGFLGKWDMDGAVPAFPAIYGGAIQVFGQYYKFDQRPTQTLAHRMQAGQALVFGAQIAANLRLPKVLDAEETLQFIRQIVQLRWELRRFFYAGRMARPPKLYGDMPTVTADWGAMVNPDPNTWVTTDAVLTGAWKIPHEQRLVLLFVNVSEEPLLATLNFDAETYGLSPGQLMGTVIVSPVADKEVWSRYTLPSNPGEPSPIPSSFQQLLFFPPRYAWAWIIEPQSIE